MFGAWKLTWHIICICFASLQIRSKVLVHGTILPTSVASGHSAYLVLTHLWGCSSFLALPTAYYFLILDWLFCFCRAPEEMSCPFAVLSLAIQFENCGHLFAVVVFTFYCMLIVLDFASFLHPALAVCKAYWNINHAIVCIFWVVCLLLCDFLDTFVCFCRTAWWTKCPRSIDHVCSPILFLYLLLLFLITFVMMVHVTIIFWFVHKKYLNTLNRYHLAMICLVREWVCQLRTVDFVYRCPITCSRYRYSESLTFVTILSVNGIMRCRLNSLLSCMMVWYSLSPQRPTVNKTYI